MTLATTLTPQQVDSFLAAKAQQVPPAEVKTVTLLEQLTRYRRVLQKYRARGYSSQQLAEFLADPQIGLAVSPSLVRKVLTLPRSNSKHGTPAATATPAPTPKPGVVKYVPNIPLKAPAPVPPATPK